MLKKILIVLMLGFLFVLWLPQLSKPSPSLQTVFRLTEHPTVIVRGAQGSALTINISFGEQEVENLLEKLSAPYPLLMIDPDWALRFPELTETIKKRSIPVALLGHHGEEYETKPELFTRQLKQFEEIFESRPLWFRTKDEQFPQSLLQQVHEAEMNALGSSVYWESGSLPKAAAGEIISIPHHQDQRATLKNIEKMMNSRSFQSLEDLLFQPSIKTKKIPK